MAKEALFLINIHKIKEMTNNKINQLYRLIRGLEDIIYPPRCVVCDRILSYGQQIHPECERQLYPVPNTVCMHCGSPVEGRREFCYDCNRKNTRIRKYMQEETCRQGKALYIYKGKIKDTMYRFKYSNKREYAEFFAEQATKRYGAWIKAKGIDAIMAVPMYRGKKKKRGYNQAEVFARALSQKLGIPYVANGIVRVKNTTPMKNLNDLERERNLKNAFQIRENIVQYYYILVVDDIYTTGSTADAVSKVMLKCGGKTVYFLSICTGQGY